MSVFLFNQISLKFVPKGPYRNESALVQVMHGETLKPEAMMVQLPDTFMCSLISP